MIRRVPRHADTIVEHRARASDDGVEPPAQEAIDVAGGKLPGVIDNDARVLVGRIPPGAEYFRHAASVRKSRPDETVAST